MKIEGTKEELEKMFKRSRDIFGFLRDDKDKKRERVPLRFRKKQKNIIFFTLIMTILISIPLMSIVAYKTYNNNYITNQECSVSRINDVNYYLSVQEENNVLAFIYAYSTFIKIIIGAILFSWILHGVGFKIIGR